MRKALQLGLSVSGLAIVALGVCCSSPIMLMRMFGASDVDAMSGDINFHGRVTDPQGQPIQGAVVTIRLSGTNRFAIINGDNPRKQFTLRRTTDRGGRFAVRRKRGRSLSVDDITHETYLWRVPTRQIDGTRDTGYEYGPGSLPAPGSTAAAPVAFEMVRLPDPEAKHETIIDFYGKVVDQTGQPVPEAEVTLKIGYSHWKPRLDDLILRTDDTGTFVVENSVGQAVFLDRIEAIGFRPLTVRDAKESDQPYEFYYSGRTAKWTFRPDPAAPVRFTLQREP